MNGEALRAEAQRLEAIADNLGGYSASVLTHVAASFRNLAADRTAVPDLDAVTDDGADQRVQALAFALDYHRTLGTQEGSRETLQRARAYHEFLLGASEAPADAVLAVQGATHTALRTRANAVDCVLAVIQGSRALSNAAIAAEVVDKLLEVAE